MRNYVLEENVISENNIRQNVYILRTTLTPFDTKTPFTFQLKQYSNVTSFIKSKES